MTEDSFHIFKEGGHSCEWFTELEIVDESHVKILSRYRLYWDEYDSWPAKNKNVMSHPNYYGCDIMKRDSNHNVTDYNLPLRTLENKNNMKCIWCKVVQ